MFGTIKSLNSKKLYGFIKTDKADYFFHRDDCDLHWLDLVEDFDRGETIQVEFEPTRTDKGLRAESVRRLNGSGV